MFRLLETRAPGEFVLLHRSNSWWGGGEVSFDIQAALSLESEPLITTLVSVSPFSPYWPSGCCLHTTRIFFITNILFALIMRQALH